MNVPFGDLRAHYHSQKKAIDEAVGRVLESGWFILGEEVKVFEQAFAEYTHTSACVSVANGTDAIEIALRGLDIGPGDEVITVSHTATFTALAITAVGATPVFVDVDAVTYTMDPKCLESAITPKTKAILPVHLYGHPADLDQILGVAERHHLPVIEDAAQAHGATYRGRKVGSLGTLGCFSFYPSKNLGAFGDGGALVTSDTTLARTLSMLRNGGQSDRYHHELLGVNSRLDELQAAILSVELQQLDQDNARRRAIASAYVAGLKDLDLTLPPVADAVHGPVFHLFVVRLKQRERVRQALSDLGIATQIHYPIPAHQQLAFTKYRQVSLPVTEKLVEEILSLPIYPEMPPAHVEAVIAGLHSVLKG